jgi:putative resolvase
MTSIAAWAEQNDVSYYTALKWFKNGCLPVPAVQPRKYGKIIVTAPTPERAAIYARVADAEGEDDLDRQVAAARSFCKRGGSFQVTKVVREVASGLSGERPLLRQLLADPDVRVIVVTDRERVLSRGAEIIEATLAAAGRRLVVVGEAGEMR